MPVQVTAGTPTEDRDADRHWEPGPSSGVGQALGQRGATEPGEKRHEGVDGSRMAAGLLLSHTKAQGAGLPRLGPLGFGLYQGVPAGPARQPME